MGSWFCADVNLIDFSLDDKKDQATKTLHEDDEEASCRRKSTLVNEGKAVSDWTVDDACLWLASLKCEQYSEEFRKHHIDGEELLNLNESMLKNVLGVGKWRKIANLGSCTEIFLPLESLGHRNRIIRALKLLHYRRGSYEAFATKANPSGEPLPHEFYCAITHELMTDPVVAAGMYKWPPLKMYPRIAKTVF